MLFSIVVPIFNTAAHLEACVRSIMEQDRSDFEVILVDDGSTDASWSICQGLSGADSRIRACQQTHQGPSAARNHGLSLASGDYVSFIDSDDVIEPGTFGLAATLLASHGADLLIFSMQHLHENGVAFNVRDLQVADGIYLSLAGFIADLLAGRRLLLYSSANKFYSRPLIERHRLRFDLETDFGEDRIFNFTYLRHASRIVTSSHIAYHYFIRPTPSLSQKFRPNHIADLLRLHGDKQDLIAEFSQDSAARDAYLLDDLSHELRSAFAHLIRHWSQLTPTARHREIAHLITAPYPPGFLRRRQPTSTRRVVNFLLRHRLAFLLRLFVAGSARFKPSV